MSLLVFGDSIDKPPGFINCIKSSCAWLDCSGVCKLPVFSGKKIIIQEYMVLMTNFQSFMQ